MKKMLSLILVLALLFTFAFPVSAAYDLRSYHQFSKKWPQCEDYLLDAPDGYPYYAIFCESAFFYVIYSRKPVIEPGDTVQFRCIVFNGLSSWSNRPYTFTTGDPVLEKIDSYSNRPFCLYFQGGHKWSLGGGTAMGLSYYVVDLSTAIPYNYDEMAAIDASGYDFLAYMYGIPENIDTSRLETLLSQAGSLDASSYTGDSWAALQSVVTEAQALLDSGSYTQDAIDAMYDRLREALDNLVRASVPDGPWINDDDSRITYSGSWTYNRDPAFYSGDKHYAKQAGSYAELTFEGTSVAWIGAKTSKSGTANVYIDGGLAAPEIDLYAPDLETQAVLYSNTGLAEGQHTIRVVATGKKSAASEDSYINIDAFAVESGETPPKASHTVTVLTRYQDGALPEEQKIYTVEDGERFEEHYEVLDGYAVDSGRLRSSFAWGIDEGNQLITIDPVERDYTVEIVFYKLPYTVSVIMQFDDGSPDRSQAYTVQPGAEFNKQFDVPDGYTYLGFQADSPDAYVIRSENRLLIDSVNQGAKFVLSFAKN